MFNAYRNENIAKRQTIQNRSSLMLTQAENLLEEGDRIDALMLSKSVMQDLDERMEQFETLRRKNFALLNHALNRGRPSYDKVIFTGNNLTYLDMSAQGTFAAGLGNHGIGVWDVRTGNLLLEKHAHRQQVKLPDLGQVGPSDRSIRISDDNQSSADRNLVNF